ncbi:hypothetical protein DFH09DRAFT_1198157 [Mycena vulgaris]|nr:hypothetical protein DFH09DRAFT_1198157 [Mycena vulgaris]
MSSSSVLSVSSMQAMLPSSSLNPSNLLLKLCLLLKLFVFCPSSVPCLAATAPLKGPPSRFRPTSSGPPTSPGGAPHPLQPEPWLIDLLLPTVVLVPDLCGLVRSRIYPAVARYGALLVRLLSCFFHFFQLTQRRTRTLHLRAHRQPQRTAGNLDAPQKLVICIFEPRGPCTSLPTCLPRSRPARSD